METVQDTLSNLMEMFQKRMTEFEGDLKKTTASPSTTASLAAEFASFKTFILQALAGLQRQVEVLAQDIDRLEMRGRRKMLLLHGVTEGKKEETALAVANVVREQLKIGNFSESDIRRCHRMGRASADNPRPIVLKLQSVDIRDNIWFAKSKLKGSGVTLSEFLTKTRHQVFMAARDKFGVDKCWTREGNVFVLGADGSRQRLNSLGDINRLVVPLVPNSPTQEVADEVVKEVAAPAPVRAKRAAAMRK